MLGFGVETTKPPAYPFITNSLKEHARDNQADSASFLTHACVHISEVSHLLSHPLRPIQPRFRAPSLSVRGVYELISDAARGKKHKRHEFFTTPRTARPTCRYTAPDRRAGPSQTRRAPTRASAAPA